MDHLTLDSGDRVATITLRSEPANALSLDLVRDLRSALDDVARGDARVLVVRSGLERFFAAGADLKLMGTLDRDGFADYLAQLRGALEQVAALPQVTIAAIDGMALGGGLELALACTLRVASPRAQLGVPEVRLGLLPGAGGTQRLPSLIGTSQALDLLLTGRAADGAEALALGLVNRLDEDAGGAAAALAAEIAAFPRGATQAIRRCVAAADGTGGMDVERHEILGLFEGADGREGIAAFLERRPAAF